MPYSTTRRQAMSNLTLPILASIAVSGVMGAAIALVVTGQAHTTADTAANRVVHKVLLANCDSGNLQKAWNIHRAEVSHDTDDVDLAAQQLPLRSCDRFVAGATSAQYAVSAVTTEQFVAMFVAGEDPYVRDGHVVRTP